MRDKPRSSAAYEALLFITAAIWGTGFVAQRLGMDSIGPLSYNAARFSLGALALVPLLAIRKTRLKDFAAAAAPGAIAGMVLSVAAGLQQAGLQYTTAGRAGFITGLYVVLVPAMAALAGKKTGRWVWLGAAIALAGLYLLSVSGAMGVNRGDILVFASAFFWTAHILVLDRYSSRMDPILLAFSQFVCAALVFWAFAIFVEREPARAFVDAALPIAYGGLFSIGIAYTLQAVGQSGAHPARAAIIMSLESPFAALAGFAILGERLSPAQLGGCALMLAGMMLAQLAPRSVSDIRTADGGAAR